MQRHEEKGKEKSFGEVFLDIFVPLCRTSIVQT